MKKLSFLACFLVLFSSVGFVSCDTEPVDPVLNENDLDDDDDDDDDNTTGGGIYWPMAIGNEWVFELDGEAQDPMEITDTQVINGNTYYEIEQFFSNAGTAGFDGEALTLIRYDDGDYSARISVEISGGAGVPAITIEPYEFIVFKDDLDVGQTWTETVTQTTIMDMPGIPPIETEIVFEGTILEKDITVEVNGTTYNDVIKSKLVQNTMGEEVTSYYWFAKDIGPVKITSDTGTGITYEHILVSYDLN